MLADYITRMSRGTPIRYAGEEVQPFSPEGLHNWLRAQIASRGLFHPLGRLAEHRRTQRDEPVNLRDLLFSNPHSFQALHELMSHPESPEILGQQHHVDLMRILANLHKAIAHPDEHLTAYTPGHELHQAANEAIREQLHRFDWQGLKDSLTAGALGHNPRQVRNLVQDAKDTGDLQPVLQMPRLITEPHKPLSLAGRAASTLLPLLQHHVAVRDKLSGFMHNALQPRQDRPNESIPEDYYALAQTGQKVRV